MKEIEDILSKLRNSDIKFKEDLTKSLQGVIIKQQIISNVLLFILVMISISRWMVMGN